MDERTFCILFDIAMAIIFFLLGLLFYRSKGRGANWLAGYNMKSEEERKNYDENKMCQMYGKRMMFWAIPFLLGAFIDFRNAGKGVLVAWGIWMVLLSLFFVERYWREK